MGVQMLMYLSMKKEDDITSALMLLLDQNLEVGSLPGHNP